jgi:DNA (cytosine-5)-methyltransferase 1
MNYYNEINTHAADWLQNLINAGLIPHGDVDRRSIRDVKPSELRGYTQCHFFAGIGGWSHALELAGWDSARPVWTGSCPCQPYSVAGKGKGKEDDRDLWPVWFRLIAECSPAVVFGEQVANAIGHGWLDRTATDLESEGYAVAAAVLPACGVGAPHRRDRLWFVAHGDNPQRRAKDTAGHYAHGAASRRDEGASNISERGSALAYGLSLDGGTRATRRLDSDSAGLRNEARGDYWGNADWIECSDGKLRAIKPGVRLLVDGLPRELAGSLAGYGNAIVPQVAATFIAAYDSL